jgi:Holliday junction DNA helicase RuvA
MIASLDGTLSYKTTNYIVIDVKGVGYGVTIPLSTFYKLPDTGERVNLIIHTNVREDSISLYGFVDQQEKDIFQMLISISGIGPRLAINILSGISADDLTCAISSDNLTKLTNIPGVGKKMADRMIFELKDKARKINGSFTPVSEEPVREDAVSALVNLGYKSGIAKKTVDQVLESSSNLTLEALLTEALKVLSG